MKTLLFGFILYGSMAIMSSDYYCIKHIEKNGMRIDWNHKNQTLEVEVFAPTHGWVALGFNNQTGLTGTNLIMANIIDGKITLSDRYTSRPGQHDAVDKIGGMNHLTLISGKETEQGTTVKFSLPKIPNDKYHKRLELAKPIYLLMAYSHFDDFDHHSIMRTELEVIL